MFYQILFDNISLGMIPRDVTLPCDVGSNFTPKEFTSLNWLRPRRDRSGELYVKPIGFLEWLKTPRVYEQLESTRPIILQGCDGSSGPFGSVVSRLRMRLFGRNTSFCRKGPPSFPDLLDAEGFCSQKTVQSLPPITLHENTRSGVHRTFQWPRVKMTFIPIINVKRAIREVS
jgi:hypothetical protein